MNTKNNSKGEGWAPIVLFFVVFVGLPVLLLISWLGGPTFDRWSNEDLKPREELLVGALKRRADDRNRMDMIGDVSPKDRIDTEKIVSAASLGTKAWFSVDSPIVYCGIYIKGGVVHRFIASTGSSDDLDDKQTPTADFQARWHDECWNTKATEELLRNHADLVVSLKAGSSSYQMDSKWIPAPAVK